MSSNWPLKKLSDVAIFRNNKRVPLKSLDRQKRQGDFPYYGASGIVDYIDDFLFDGTYLLISEDGENLRTRKTPIAFQAHGKFWVNNHAHILEEKEDGILDYLEYYFSILDLIPYITGAVQPKLNKANLDTIEIPIPPPDERKFINENLNKFRDKILLNSETNQTLEQIAQALFKSWFVDFDPVKAKISVLEAGGTTEEAELAAMRVIAAKSSEQLAELKQSKPDAYEQLAQTAALFPSAMQESELGEIPEGWDISPFSKIANLDTSSVKPNKKLGEQWEHYSIPAFDANQSPAFELGKTIKSGKYRVNPTSVLSSKLNPHFPRTWWPDVEDEELAICSTEFMQFVPHKAEYRPFMYGMITSLPFQQGIQQRVTGSTGSRQRAQPPQVASMDVVIPPEKLISMYSKRLISLHQKAAKNIKQNNQLSFLRDAILPEALSGRLFNSETIEA